MFAAAWANMKLSSTHHTWGEQNGITELPISNLCLFQAVEPETQQRIIKILQDRPG